MQQMKLLAVIPARKGSKGIPRKNIRLMNGKPLIAYALLNARACTAITDIAVTTDDLEVLEIAESYGAEPLVRPSELAEDHVTLDPVIYDAVLKMEKKRGIRYDAVITLQATSPLLKSTTLSQAITAFFNGNIDTCISVVNRAHLSWGKDGQEYYPRYRERLNRQQLPADYQETGAFFLTKREFITKESRMGKHVSVYEIEDRESVDIDTDQDWIVCEHELGKKRIVFRADGYKERGMGHIYHCLTLAFRLTGHEIMFVTNKNHKEGYEKLKSSFLPVYGIEREEDFYDYLKEHHTDIIVNDCLNTTKEHVQRLKTFAKRVITIEDLGEGAIYADAVINALYHVEMPYPNHYIGAEYVCLRDEFLRRRPKAFSDTVKKVLIMFGGTDPLNLTGRLYKMAEQLQQEQEGLELHFILGSGYSAIENGIYSKENNIYVHSDVTNVSKHMREADLAITSQGRTVFELAVMGVPAIVLAQNKREQLHTFAQMENGFLNLGLGTEVEDDTLLSTFRWLVHTPQIRKEMRDLMLQNKLEKGTDRVIEIILKEA